MHNCLLSSLATSLAYLYKARDYKEQKNYRKKRNKEGHAAYTTRLGGEKGQCQGKKTLKQPNNDHVKQ